MRDVNLEIIIDMQSWCKTWPPNGFNHIRAKQKLLRKHKGACKSSWSRIGNLESFTLEEMDASEIHARRLNAKEASTTMKGDYLIFPVADGTVKISGGDRRLRPSTLVRDRPEGEDKLRGESDGSSWRIISYCTEIYRRYQDYRHTFGCNVG